MFAWFDENQAMNLQDIKETKRYGRTHGRTHGRTDGQRENSIPLTNKACGGIKSPSNVLKKFADTRILPFYMELNGTDSLCIKP